MFIIYYLHMDLIALARSVLQDPQIEKIAEYTKTDKDTAWDATSSIMDLLLAGLTKNSSTPEWAASLHTAITEDHDSSLLDNITSLFGSQPNTAASSKALDGAWIIKHILGDKTDASAELVSKKTGMDKETVMNLIVKLAPVAMAMLSKAKNDTNSDANGVAGLLKTAAQKEQTSTGFMWFIGKFLDQDGDGSYMDDLAEFAMKKFMNK